MSAKPKLTPEQVKLVHERNLLYMRLRIEAAKHSVDTMAREFNVHRHTILAYLNRKAG